MTETDLPDWVAAAGIDGLNECRRVTEPHWRFWEYRTLNRHRVVAHWSARRGFANLDELGRSVRQMISAHFKAAWWRGLAFGAVVDVVSLNMKGAELEKLVDVRDNAQGTFQWVVVRSSLDPVALGVHTWMEGFLSPAYRSILRGLADSGYRVASVRREKTGATKVLFDLADLGTAVHTLGLRTSMTEEFRNGF